MVRFPKVFALLQVFYKPQPRFGYSPREHRSCILPGGSPGQEGALPAQLQAMLLCVVQQDQPHWPSPCRESLALLHELHTHTHATASRILTLLLLSIFSDHFIWFCASSLFNGFSPQFLQSQNTNNISQTRQRQTPFYIQNAVCPAEWKRWGCVCFFHKQ